MRNKLNSLHIVFYMLSILLFIYFFQSCDCKTNVIFGALREGQALPNNVERTGGYTVLICPNEGVKLGWIVSSDVSSASINTVGAIPVPQNEKIVHPASTITYTLDANGSCNVKKSVDVIVVTTGLVYSIKANQLAAYWEAILDPAFYSPNIEVTDVRITYPVTDIEWNCDKMNLGGVPPNSFKIGNAWTKPTASGAPIPLAGTWHFTPIPKANTSIELIRRAGDIQFEVKLKCAN